MARRVHDSCGNVFADLGLPDADRLLAEAALAEYRETGGVTLAEMKAELGIGDDLPREGNGG